MSIAYRNVGKKVFCPTSWANKLDLILYQIYNWFVNRLPPCFSNLFPHINIVNHRLAFYQQVDEPFIKALNPEGDQQGWLKNQNNLLEQIWQV